MPRKTQVICFANNKGGSGKSTTCANLGYALTKLGSKVLLIDADMQLNLSLSYFDEDTVFDLAQGEKNLFQAIKQQKDLTDCIAHTKYENLDVIPSSTLMSGIEFELFTKMQREFVLKKCLSKVKESGVYDYILIDAPPMLGTWVINILAASDHIIIPVEASPRGLFGLANMFEYISQIREIAPELSIMGIAVTKASERKNYFKQTMETLREADTYVFKSYIRVDVNIEKAQDESKPVLAFSSKCRSSEDYMALAKEVDSIVNR